MSIRPLYLWIAGGALALLLGYLLFSSFFPSQPPAVRQAAGELTKKQENAVQANIDKQHQLAKADTLAAAAQTKAAEHTGVRIETMRQEVVITHQKSTHHAKPVPVTAAGIDSLQSFLLHYGERPGGER